MNLSLILLTLNSAIHHVGCMAALNLVGFRAKALNLTWFRAKALNLTWFRANSELFFVPL